MAEFGRRCLNDLVDGGAGSGYCASFVEAAWWWRGLELRGPSMLFGWDLDLELVRRWSGVKVSIVGDRIGIPGVLSLPRSNGGESMELGEKYVNVNSLVS